MQISIDELNDLLQKEFERGKNSNKKEISTPDWPLDLMDVIHTTFIPKACKECSNHPANGGSGICSCMLPDEIIY